MNKNLVVNVSAAISLVFAIWASIPYIYYVLKGKTKPHQFTWLIFCIMNGIVFITQFLKGARASVILYGVWFVSSFVILVLSFKRGLRGTSRWDYVLFGLSLATIGAWAVTKNPSVAIWLSMLIDVFATSMMILKIKARPDTEALGPWVIASVAYVFTIASLANKPLGILYVRPIYGLISEVAVLAAIIVYAKDSGQKKIEASPTIQ